MAVNDEECRVQELSEIVPQFHFDPNEPFFNILVNTSETVGQRMLARI